MNKLISIIIPVYNAERYISRCLESLINQSYKYLEIICINDKSKDNSLKILQDYSKKDERIIVIENTENKGAALTRNAGVDIAKGEYINFIDADDYIDEKYLECMLKKIEETNSDIVLNMSILTENNNIASEFYHPTMPKFNKAGEFFDKISTIHNAPCFIWARMYRKSFLNKFNLRFLDIRATDDVVFNAIVNMYCDKTFVFYGEKYHYNVYNQSVTGNAKNVDDKDLQHIKAYSLIYDFLKERNLLDNRLKLFRVYPFIRVNTDEKFNYYKSFFKKIEADFHKNENIYNEMENILHIVY
ncbi:glycosyltransferase family 2 protein [bacterium]|nr:glycosyltransferase family 2 protein [bacterium]